MLNKVLLLSLYKIFNLTTNNTDTLFIILPSDYPSHEDLLKDRPPQLSKMKLEKKTNLTYIAIYIYI